MAETLGPTRPQSWRRKRSAHGKSLSPYLFLILEGERPLAGSLRICLKGLDRIVIGRGSSRRAQRIDDEGKNTLRLYVPDECISATHATVTRKGKRWLLEDADSSNGTQIDGKDQEAAVLLDGVVVQLGQTVFLYRDALSASSHEEGGVASFEVQDKGIHTLVPDLAERFEALKRIAESRTSILITGPTGSGKEIIATAIHQFSDRARKQLVAVNCGALPETLIESELFGHVRGAFSDAKADKVGLIAESSGGTLFLDEIGDLRVLSQATLLRVLEDSLVRPVGSNKATKVDLRVVAATHQNVDGMIEAGAFREDLFSRLQGYRISLPALAHRREDTGIIVGALLARYAKNAGSGLSLSADAMRALLAYSWPRNIRELSKVLESAITLADDGCIAVDDLPEEVASALTFEPVDDRPLTPEEEARRTEIEGLLQVHKGNVSAAARAMGTKRQQLQRWVKRFKLVPLEYQAGNHTDE